MNKKMLELGSNRSVIRELFEYGRAHANLYGEDSVFDFSLGNPNIPAPKSINEKIKQLADDPTAHLYTSAQGDSIVRKKISDFIKSEYNGNIPPELIYMTTGAAAALSIVFKALCDDQKNEFIVFAPFFPEYKVFVESAGGVIKIQKPNEGFGLNLDGLDNLITDKTVGIIINSPVNPTGNVYSESELNALVELLNKYRNNGQHIYIIADEPYRELVYDNTVVPYIPNMYDDTIVCYSWSKSLSLAGERIGYIAVSPRIEESHNLYLAICGAGRSLGYVCASSLFQRVVADCLGQTADLELYRANRDKLYSALVQYGFTVIEPKGAFYLFVRSPIDNSQFIDKAKELGLLLVPSESFGISNWVRIAYCVDPDMLSRSLPIFATLAKKCGLSK